MLPFLERGCSPFSSRSINSTEQAQRRAGLFAISATFTLRRMTGTQPFLFWSKPQLFSGRWELATSPSPRRFKESDEIMHAGHLRGPGCSEGMPSKCACHQHVGSEGPYSGACKYIRGAPLIWQSDSTWLVKPEGLQGETNSLSHLGRWIARNRSRANKDGCRVLFAIFLFLVPVPALFVEKKK